MTESQQGLNNRTLFWPRGKTLGGASSMNALIYQRDQPQDYDQWQSLGDYDRREMCGRYAELISSE